MKSIWHLFKIKPATYILILAFLFTGLIKNIILIYGIVIFHELGHVLITKLLKYKILSIEIEPMGGITKIDKPINTPIKEELLIASMGVIFQLILFGLFYILFKNGLVLRNTYIMFINYNKTILLFNLLPIIPLDGYIILKSILEYIMSFNKAFYLSLLISIVSVILFMSYKQVFSLNNYLIISFLIYKIYREYKEFKFKHLKFLLERYLGKFKYYKIKYNMEININDLKKDTYHYFKNNNSYISEKVVLKDKFKNIK